jgi:hypothetical protein
MKTDSSGPSPARMPVPAATETKRQRALPDDSFREKYAAGAQTGSGEESEAAGRAEVVPAEQEPAEQVWKFGGLPDTGVLRVEVSDVEETTPIAAPSRLVELSSEIVSAIHSAGPGNVEIAFDSGVLSGLHISIDRTDAGLSIRFAAVSPELGSLLSAHVPALASTLAAAGIPVQSIALGIGAPLPGPGGGRRFR